MEFKIGNGTLFLPPLHITIIAIIIFILLFRWSKQLETRRYRIFLYFLISTYIAAIYSHSTKDGVFELWIPLGFIVVFLHLFRSKSYHPAKMKASVLGLSIAIYRLIQHYIG
ncbi:hypothetical protein HHO41_03560 [Bacillus sp. DNRA2]|uniref:hypothetical protein n=1 Tax=Bacillus sp. DNRA2 TaxID=2723053 RepID=UPI00145FA974|nr:hypothetical protein [Bacillus sp. DNRA2]NMD69352.1 hypothetical protein [Bacillus sp. DNRA2]